MKNFPISITPEIREILAAGAPVAIGVSGGKDSGAVALRLHDYLKEIGHTGPKVLIHSDLGVVEWRESLPVCQRLAARIGWELIVVRRSAGDLMDRWEKRWQNNVARYESLSCVKLILPWSTPAMRFCTSELKTDIICSALKKRFPGEKILSVTGVRHDESASRAKMSCCQVQPKLTKKGVTGWNWNPIIEWPTDKVFAYLALKQEPLHEAYTIYRCSRVSCAFCIMAAFCDLQAASACVDNHSLLRRTVRLEIASTFAFQGSRWLGDVAPHLLSARMAEELKMAKQAAQIRIAAEARLSKHLFYVKGWPLAVPTMEEATLIADVRREVSTVLGLKGTFITPGSIRERYADLLKARQKKLATRFEAAA